MIFFSCPTFLFKVLSSHQGRISSVSPQTAYSFLAPCGRSMDEEFLFFPSWLSFNAHPPRAVPFCGLISVILRETPPIFDSPRFGVTSASHRLHRLFPPFASPQRRNRPNPPLLSKRLFPKRQQQKLSHSFDFIQSNGGLRPNHMFYLFPAISGCFVRLRAVFCIDARSGFVFSLGQFCLAFFPILPEPLFWL